MTWAWRWWWMPSCSGWTRSIRWLDAADAPAQAGRAADPARHCPAPVPQLRRLPKRRRHRREVRRDERAGAAAACRRPTARALPRCTRWATSTCRCEAGAMVAVMGPSGSGKSTLLTIAGQPGGTHQRGGAGLRHRAGGDVAQRQGPAAAPRDRVRVPGFQPAARADRRRERRLAAGTRRAAARGRPAPPGWRRWTSSAWPSGPSRFPDRAVRRRAAAGGDRPRGGGGPPAAAGRRAVRRAGLGATPRR